MKEDLPLVVSKDKMCFQRPWPWWRWIYIKLNVLALVLSVIMSWHYLNGGSMIGCSGGSSCDEVLSSQWSLVAGVLPVSGLAVGAYLALLIASLFIGPAVEVSVRRLAWNSMLIIVGSIAGSAIWFTIVQKWIIGSFCIYCMITHITGLLLAALVIWRAITEFENHSSDIPLRNPAMVQNVFPTTPQRIIRPLRAMGLVLIGLILAGILAVCQISFTRPTVYHDSESQEILSIKDYHDVPMIGSPDAPYIVTLLFDYQCSHCQKIHFMLDEAVRRFDGKLSFVLCPTPLNTQCNRYVPRDVDEFKNSCELVKIGLAIWVAKREEFSVFENWMYSFESGDSWHPRSLESARAKAVELVGQTKFDAAWTDPWIGQYMQTSVRIYGQTIQNGKGGIPKLIYGSNWVIPEPHNTDDLMIILQKSLAVPTPSNGTASGESLINRK